MGPALFLIGLAINTVGWLMVVWIAFKESVGWGIACLLVPLAYIVFVITHWQDARKGFFTALGGMAILLFSVVAMPSPPKTVPQPAQQPPQQQQAAMVPDTTTHATFESVTRQLPDPQPAPAPRVEEPVQPLLTQVWADNQTRMYYPKDCAKHPENAYLLAKSVATAQGFKAAPCK